MRSKQRNLPSDQPKANATFGWRWLFWFTLVDSSGVAEDASPLGRVGLTHQKRLQNRSLEALDILNQHQAGSEIL
jgi:hypothetical protein